MLWIPTRKYSGYEGPPSDIWSLLYWNPDQYKRYMSHCPLLRRTSSSLALISWVWVYSSYYSPSNMLGFRFDAGLNPCFQWLYLLSVNIFTSLLDWWRYRWFEFPVVVVFLRFIQLLHRVYLSSFNLCLLENYLGPGITSDAARICKWSDVVKALSRDNEVFFPDSSSGVKF